MPAVAAVVAFPKVALNFLSSSPDSTVKLTPFVVFCWFLTLCVLPCSALAEEARLEFTQFSLEKKEHTLTLLSQIRLNNDNMVRNQLRDGAQMVLKGVVTLHRLRTLLSNELLGQAEVVVHLRHDPLRKEFMAFRAQQVYQNRNLAQALYTAWDSAPVALVLAQPLAADESYRVTMHLTLQHAEVPPWLEKALFFWSWDVVPPVDVTQDFQF